VVHPPEVGTLLAGEPWVGARVALVGAAGGEVGRHAQPQRLGVALSGQGGQGVQPVAVDVVPAPRQGPSKDSRATRLLGVLTSRGDR
jgi:hypothetical protein